MLYFLNEISNSDNIYTNSWTVWIKMSYSLLQIYKFLVYCRNSDKWNAYHVVSAVKDLLHYDLHKSLVY